MSITLTYRSDKALVRAYAARRTGTRAITPRRFLNHAVVPVLLPLI